MKTLLAFLLCTCAWPALAQGGPAGQVAPAPQGGNLAAGRGGRGGFPNLEPQKILLWENGAPGATGNTDADQPSITFYRAGGRGGNNAAVIVAPGGAYRVLSIPGGE